MTLIPIRRMIAFIVAGVTFAAPADILHLRDGTRYQGEWVSQTNSEVVFRIQLSGGRSTAVRHFDRNRVKSIEIGAISADVEPSPTLPDNEMPRGSAADLEQMLREAFELLDDRDAVAALRAMQRAVTSAGPQDLAALERQTRVARGRSLAELMAATRIAIASGSRLQHGFDIRGVTPYETRALGVLLEGLQSDALGESIAGRALSAWAAAPARYTELTPDARKLVDRARRAAAIIAARLRVDPRVRGTGPTRVAIVKLREDLAALAIHVSSMEGFTALSAGATPEDDPTLAEAQRLTDAAAEAEAAASQPASGPSDADAPASQPAVNEPAEHKTDRPER